MYLGWFRVDLNKIFTETWWNDRSLYGRVVFYLVYRALEKYVKLTVWPDWEIVILCPLFVSKFAESIYAHLLSSYEYLVNLSISVVVIRAYALNKCITMSLIDSLDGSTHGRPRPTGAF